VPHDAYEMIKRRLEETWAEASKFARRTARENTLIRERQLARSSERMLRAGRTAIEDAFRRGLLSENVADDLKEEMDALLIQGAEAGWDDVWGLEETQEPPADEP
jgi:hypothetical protein